MTRTSSCLSMAKAISAGLNGTFFVTFANTPRVTSLLATTAPRYQPSFISKVTLSLQKLFFRKSLQTKKNPFTSNSLPFSEKKAGIFVKFGLASMTNMPAKISFLSVVFLFSHLTAGAGFDISPGKQIPSLTLPSAREHKPLTTDSFLGKKTLVHIFASW